MNDYLVWSPLYKVDRTKYLYHYTSVEKAFKILYYKTLQFADITTTNDIFEQKPKLSFDETDLNTFDMVRTIQKYFLKEQNRVRILCFSQDYEKDINMDNLSRDQRRANVIGRGFALPRMWAQYSSNNEGVCLIINKDKLLNYISAQEIFNINNKVNYVKNYLTYPMNKEYIIKLYKKIISNSFDVFSTLVKDDSDFVKFNFFSKLDDWQSENEFRILTLVNENNLDKVIKINNIYKFVEGIVVGQNISDENCFILHQLVDGNTIIRRIHFDNIITRIQDI